MNGRLRVALAGCGVQAQVALLPALKSHPAIELVALCDTDVRKLHTLCARYHVKRYYTEFDRLKDDPEVNAIVISTPNYLHAPMAIAALEGGKDVLCEMPLAMNTAEVRAMVATAKRERRRLMPCLVARLRADVRTVREYVSRGELGQLYYVKTGWLRSRHQWSPTGWQRDRLSAGGGAFLNLGSTLLDAALALVAPARPVSVIGVAGTHQRTAGPRPPGVEDTAFALLRFDSGLVLTVEVGWSLLSERDFVYCNLFGTQGAAVIDPLTITREIQGRLVDITPPVERQPPVRRAYELLIRNWVQALLDDLPPEVTVGDALLINRIADAFYRSNATGAEVRLNWESGDELN